MNFLEYLNKRIEEDPELKESYYRKDLENLLLDIGNEIERERVKNGIKQNELAKKLKTSQSYISRLENGSLSPSIKMLQKIAETFGGFVDFKISYENKNKETSDTQVFSEKNYPNYYISGGEIKTMTEETFNKKTENMFV